MDKKYTPESIKKALEPWEIYKDLSVKKGQFVPRSYAKDINGQIEKHTVIFVNKKYPLYNNRLMPSHVFTRIDGIVFHPGAPHLDIFELDETRDSTVVSIEEKCKKCAYYHIKNLIEKDKNFNILINNCQVIMGHSHETYLLLIAYVLLILYVITGKAKLTYGTLVIVIFVIIYEGLSSSHNKFSYSTCEHVQAL